MINWKKKEFFYWCISKILFIDTEQLSKTQISLRVFFKDFVERFRNTWKIPFMLIDFRKATNLKTGSPKKYSWKILFVDSKTSTAKIIYLKVH